MKRRERTRHLIELGGLVVKAGLVDLTDDDRATIYGALLTVAQPVFTTNGTLPAGKYDLGAHGQVDVSEFIDNEDVDYRSMLEVEKTGENSAEFRIMLRSYDVSDKTLVNSAMVCVTIRE